MTRPGTVKLTCIYPQGNNIISIVTYSTTLHLHILIEYRKGKEKERKRKKRKKRKKRIDI
jgi:hypothetical protein